jgi:hypothetical protein
MAGTAPWIGRPLWAEVPDAFGRVIAASDGGRVGGTAALALRLELRKNQPTIWVVIAGVADLPTRWEPFDLMAVNDWGHRRVVMSIPDEYQANALLRRALEELGGLGDDLFAQLWGLPAEFLTQEYQPPKPGRWRRFVSPVSDR